MFRTKTRSVAEQSQLYLKGLFQAEKGKRNIERMSEKAEGGEYYAMQHFISDSPWDAEAVKKDVARDVGAMFKDAGLVGLIIDESGIEKKGRESVGVAHQYCGNRGKVCNSQIAVYGCLVEGCYGALVDARLYLPKEWAEDKARCKKAGVPEDKRVHKKKTELALEIIKAKRGDGTRIDFISADAFYGNESGFLEALDAAGELFVVDIQSNRTVYTSRPVIAKPPLKRDPGKLSKNYKSDIRGLSAGAYMEGLSTEQWEKVQVRKGTKGIINAKVHAKEVFTWDDHGGQKTNRWLLVIMKTGEGAAAEYRYALSNASNGRLTCQQLAYMMAQRFWVEHSFRENKQEIGMADYQVRGWVAWHHHIAMCMMAQCFVLSEKLLFKEDLPLLSAYDIRMMLIKQLMDKQREEDELIRQMEARHKQRKNGIDWHHSKNSS